MLSHYMFCKTCLLNSFSLLIHLSLLYFTDFHFWLLVFTFHSHLNITCALFCSALHIAGTLDCAGVFWCSETGSVPRDDERDAGEGDSDGAELLLALIQPLEEMCGHRQECVQQRNLPWRQVHSPAEVCGHLTVPWMSPVSVLIFLPQIEKLKEVEKKVHSQKRTVGPLLSVWRAECLQWEQSYVAVPIILAARWLDVRIVVDAVALERTFCRVSSLVPF